MKSFLLLINSLFALFFANTASAAPVVQEEPVLILGGGIGALTSATYLARGGITPIVIEGQTPGGALAQSPSVQNWPGELDLPGWEITDKVRAQAVANGVKIAKQEVTSVDFSKSPYTVTTKDLLSGATQVYKTKSVIIALGGSPKHLNIKGEEEFWLNGVYHCAVCDGSLYKGKEIAVIGGGDTAILDAEYLSNVVKKVTIFVRGDHFKGSEKQREEILRSKNNVEILFNSSLKEIKGDQGGVKSVIAKVGDKENEIAMDAVFLAVGNRPNSQMFQGQLDLDKNGYIVLKKGMETSVKGVYAIGDIVDPIYQQAVSAAGDGAKAALDAHRYLMSSGTLLASTTAVEEKPAVAAKRGVIEVNSLKEFEELMKDGSVPAFVDFYATWCGPCKQLAPMFEEWERASEGKVRFIKVNIDVAEDLARLYEIRSMPTLISFDENGKVVTRKVGTYQIRDYISSYIKTLQL